MKLENHTYMHAGFGNIICYMLVVLLLGGCIDESKKNCPSEEEVEERFLLLTVRDVLTNEDITETISLQNVTLYLFDSDKKFLNRIEVPASQLANRIPINITDIEADDGYAVVWANVSETAVAVSEPEQGQLVNELSIYKQRNELYSNYFNCSGDLFFGYLPLLPDSRVEKFYEVDIKRKNGRLNITVRGMGADIDPYDYFLKISTLNAGYNFEGMPISGQTDIRAWPKLDEAFNLVLAEPHYLIHSLVNHEVVDNERVTIHVMRADDDRFGEGSELVADDRDENGELVTIESGKTTNVLFDLNAKGDLTVHIVMTPWDEIYQWNNW